MLMKLGKVCSSSWTYGKFTGRRGLVENLKRKEESKENLNFLRQQQGSSSPTTSQVALNSSVEQESLISTREYNK